MTSEEKKESAVSIVMPLWNNSREVKRAIQGILRQTHAHYELLIVDDGSTDDSAAVVKSFTDGRIRFVQQKHTGVSAARNRGYREAHHDLIAFCDADDEWCPFFLETIVQLYLKYSGCSIFATHYSYRGRDGTVRLPILRGVPRGAWEGILDNYFSVAAKSDPPIWSSAVAVKKKALQSVGGFHEDVHSGEDLLLWATLAVRFHIAYTSKPSAIFWLRDEIAKPTKPPSNPDLVGDQLLALLPAVDLHHRKYFLRYVSLWHRMRASTCLEFGLSSEALREVGIMFRCHPMDWHVLYYALLLLLPPKLRTQAASMMLKIKKHLRSRIQAA